MRCPLCHEAESRVLESRMLEDETCLRRRRECSSCSGRFTTYERVELMPLMVVKRDSRREPFEPRKLATGLMRACVKTRISAPTIEGLVHEIERELQKRPTREVHATELGEMALMRLRHLDEVAYVRFASVYRSFSSIEDFIRELSTLQATHR